MQKEQYEIGEPVYLQFDLTNVGKKPVHLIRGDRYFHCGGYRIEVSSGPPISHSSCHQGFAGSCLAGEQIVAPGEAIHERLLLNYQHPLAKAASYDIHAAFVVSYGSNREELSDILRVAEDLQIQLTDGTGETLTSAFEPFLADLASKDEERQREAARVIGSLAPAFLEDTILSMMGSASSRPFALLGLRRLDTVRSRAALAEVVEGTAGYSYEKEQAIKYLSEMGDRKYFPLLLGVARQQPPNQARDYVLAAARLGGEGALPFIDSLLDDSDPFSRANGVMALSETGTRRAVPFLIETLKSKETDLGTLASIGLIELTHRSPFADGKMYSDSPSIQYPDWSRWWRLHGKQASVYGPDQCGEIEPLN